MAKKRIWISTLGGILGITAIGTLATAIAYNKNSNIVITFKDSQSDKILLKLNCKSGVTLNKYKSEIEKKINSLQSIKHNKEIDWNKSCFEDNNQSAFNDKKIYTSKTVTLHFKFDAIFSTDFIINFDKTFIGGNEEKQSIEKQILETFTSGKNNQNIKFSWKEENVKTTLRISNNNIQYYFSNLDENTDFKIDNENPNNSFITLNAINKSLVIRDEFSTKYNSFKLEPLEPNINGKPKIIKLKKLFNNTFQTDEEDVNKLVVFNYKPYTNITMLGNDGTIVKNDVFESNIDSKELENSYLLMTNDKLLRTLNMYIDSKGYNDGNRNNIEISYYKYDPIAKQYKEITLNSNIDKNEWVLQDQNKKVVNLYEIDHLAHNMTISKSKDNKPIYELLLTKITSDEKYNYFDNTEKIVDYLQKDNTYKNATLINISNGNTIITEPEKIEKEKLTELLGANHSITLSLFEPATFNSKELWFYIHDNQFKAKEIQNIDIEKLTDDQIEEKLNNYFNNDDLKKVLIDDVLSKNELKNFDYNFKISNIEIKSSENIYKIKVATLYIVKYNYHFVINGEVKENIVKLSEKHDFGKDLNQSDIDFIVTNICADAILKGELDATKNIVTLESYDKETHTIHFSKSKKQNLTTRVISFTYFSYDANNKLEGKNSGNLKLYLDIENFHNKILNRYDDVDSEFANDIKNLENLLKDLKSTPSTKELPIDNIDSLQKYLNDDDNFVTYKDKNNKDIKGLSKWININIIDGKEPKIYKKISPYLADDFDNKINEICEKNSIDNDDIKKRLKDSIAAAYESHKNKDTVPYSIEGFIYSNLPNKIGYKVNNELVNNFQDFIYKSDRFFYYTGISKELPNNFNLALEEAFEAEAINKNINIMDEWNFAKTFNQLAEKSTNTTLKNVKVIDVTKYRFVYNENSAEVIVIEKGKANYNEIKKEFNSYLKNANSLSISLTYLNENSILINNENEEFVFAKGKIQNGKNIIINTPNGPKDINIGKDIIIGDDPDEDSINEVVEKLKTTFNENMILAVVGNNAFDTYFNNKDDLHSLARLLLINIFDNASHKEFLINQGALNQENNWLILPNNSIKLKSASGKTSIWIKNSFEETCNLFALNLSDSGKNNIKIDNHMYSLAEVHKDHWKTFEEKVYNALKDKAKIQNKEAIVEGVDAVPITNEDNAYLGLLKNSYASDTDKNSFFVKGSESNWYYKYSNDGQSLLNQLIKENYKQEELEYSLINLNKFLKNTINDCITGKTNGYNVSQTAIPFDDSLVKIISNKDSIYFISNQKDNGGGLQTTISIIKKQRNIYYREKNRYIHSSLLAVTVNILGTESWHFLKDSGTRLDSNLRSVLDVKIVDDNNYWILYKENENDLVLQEYKINEKNPDDYKNYLTLANSFPRKNKKLDAWQTFYENSFYTKYNFYNTEKEYWFHGELWNKNCHPTNEMYSYPDPNKLTFIRIRNDPNWEEIGVPQFKILCSNDATNLNGEETKRDSILYNFICYNTNKHKTSSYFSQSLLNGPDWRHEWLSKKIENYIYFGDFNDFYVNNNNNIETNNWKHAEFNNNLLSIKNAIKMNDEQKNKIEISDITFSNYPDIEYGDSPKNIINIHDQTINNKQNTKEITLKYTPIKILSCSNDRNKIIYVYKEGNKNKYSYYVNGIEANIDSLPSNYY